MELQAIRNLFQAVLIRALCDACGSFEGGVKPSSHPVLRRQARSYFTTAGSDFEEVCAFAGLYGHWVRERALEIIAHNDDGHALPRMRRVI